MSELIMPTEFEINRAMADIVYTKCTHTHTHTHTHIHTHRVGVYGDYYRDIIDMIA